MTDPTRSIRGGAAGVVSPTYTGVDPAKPGRTDETIISRLGPDGFRRLVRGLRTGEAQALADRLRRGG